MYKQVHVTENKVCSEAVENSREWRAIVCLQVMFANIYHIIFFSICKLFLHAVIEVHAVEEL